MSSVGNRTLMAGGVWLVPPEERPPGWEALPVREAEPHPAPDTVITNTTRSPYPITQELIEDDKAAQADSPAGPSEADVAAAVGQVAEDTDDDEPEKLCGCGQPLSHPRGCSVRSAIAQQTLSERRLKPDAWRVLEDSVYASAKAGGMEGHVVDAALVMLAGMWDRDLRRIAGLTGVPTARVRTYSERLLALNLWHPGGGPGEEHYTVELGLTTEKDGDIGLWLHAMVVAGILVGQRENGKIMVSLPKGARHA